MKRNLLSDVVLEVYYNVFFKLKKQVYHVWDLGLLTCDLKLDFVEFLNFTFWVKNICKVYKTGANSFVQ